MLMCDVWYTMVDFDEVVIGIYQPSKVIFTSSEPEKVICTEAESQGEYQD